MEGVLRTSRSLVSRRPAVFLTGLAGGCGFIAGYWSCARQKKPTRKKDVREWQWFIGGMTCALGLLGAGNLLTRRFMYPKPEMIFNSILPKLRASREVSQLIGHRLEPGNFRAYSWVGGGWEWIGAPFFIKWKPRGIELMFQVNGECGSGMVSACVQGGPSSMLRRREPVYQSLAVDLPTGERAILKGTVDNVVFKGYTQLR